MPETHYIEIDEEIISAVSRLRRSGDQENIFVFPKRSLILQSIINLKLLGREADKLGKRVIIMTQDDQGKRLAEKAGLRTQEYQDAALRGQRQEVAARFTVRHGESIPMPTPTTEIHAGLRRSSEIGSSNFYGEVSGTAAPTNNVPSIAVLPASEKRSKTLRVRNMSPPIPTSLNSTQNATSRAPLTQSRSRKLSQEKGLIQDNQVGGMETVRKEKLRRLFESHNVTSRTTHTVPDSLAPHAPSSLTGRKAGSVSSNRGAWPWLAIGVLLFAAILTGGYFYLRPKAIVAIEPYSMTQAIQLSLVGAVESTNESNTVPARYVEEEKTIRFSREATGKESVSTAKSSGTITISNSFSEASQPLVATTRFETSDGKIYRLIEGTTVPGAKTEDGKMVPGKIDARVIADEAGMKYNISSATFTIPGFKGGPKYDKIVAETRSAFTGGSDDISGAKLLVSQSDLDAAQNAAEEEAKTTIFNTLAGGLKPGEAILTPSFQVAVIGTPIAPMVGEIMEKFDYEARFRVRGFVISESAIRQIIDQEKVETNGIALSPYHYVVNYGLARSNFETKRVDFGVESKVLFSAPLDNVILREGLLGLNEEGIRSYLAKHPEIKRLQVEFDPKAFIATIPSNAGRVTVNILEPSSE